MTNEIGDLIDQMVISQLFYNIFPFFYILPRLSDDSGAEDLLHNYRLII